MRQGRQGAALIAAALLAVALLMPASVSGASLVRATNVSSAGTTPGVTSTAINVVGIVGSDPRSTGADVGAQARFARAERGPRIHGRSVHYLRTEPVADAATADAAATRVASEAFAVVPAVGESVGATVLDRAGVPFFGAANTAEWYANRTGFGITGAAVTDRTRTASSPLGVQIHIVMGGSTAPVSIYTDDDPAGAARAKYARRSLRAAGFRSVVVTPVAPPPNAVAIVAAGSAPPVGVAVFLTATARTADLVSQFVAAGSTATIVVGAEFYAPALPSVANGLTVLTPIAPFEERTAANRRFAADLESFAPGTVPTPAIAAGYWSADLFLRGLDAAGRHLTRATLLDALNGQHFTYEVAGTLGRSTWPEMHTQPVPCASLAQSDGTRYLVVAPYRCAPAQRTR